MSLADAPIQPLHDQSEDDQACHEQHSQVNSDLACHRAEKRLAQGRSGVGGGAQSSQHNHETGQAVGRDNHYQRSAVVPLSWRGISAQA